MRICVLIVDDESPIVIAIMRAFVSRWVVTACTSTEQALEILEGPSEFDAILVDIVVPGDLTGFELFDRITPARQARVIFCTGGGARTSELMRLQNTRRPVVMKPFDIDTVEKAVELVAAQEGSRGPQ